MSGDPLDAQRVWGPTINSNAGRTIDKFHIGTCRPLLPNNDEVAKSYGAAAAHCDASTNKFVEGLRDRLLTFCPRFNTSVVASRQNRTFWPPENFREGGELSRDLSTGLFFGSSYLFENVQSGKVLSSVTLPMDQVTRFLDNLARVEAKKKEYFFSDYAESLILFPSIGRPVALPDIMISMNNNYRLVEHIKSLTINTASLANEDVISPFIEKAKNLDSLTLAKCSLRSIASTLLPEIQKSTLTKLDLHGNDLGIDDEMSEEVGTAIADLLKYNKFLLSVNLSQNNFTPKLARTVLDALALSDTTLLPEDLPPEPEEELPPIEEYVDRTLFFGSDEEEDDEEPEEEEEEEEEREPEEDEAEAEDEDEEDDEVKEKKKKGKKPPFAGGSDEEDEEEEEEEEEGGDDAEGEAGEAGEEGEEDEEEGPKIDPKIERRFNRLFKRHFREETKERKEIVLEFLNESLNVAQEILSIRERKEREKQDKISKYCRRRSGWSHIQELNFRGNRLGDAGAIGLALTLRDEVKLTEEEVEKIETDLREKTEAMVEELIRHRQETLGEEIRHFKHLRREAKQERKEIKSKEAESVVKPVEVHPAFILNDNDEEDDEEQDAPEQDVVMTNVEEDGQEEMPEEEQEEEVEGEAELEDREPWRIPILPTKSGLNSIRFLDLGSCEIGSKGLKKISATLESNKVLETLILRNNTKFAVLFKTVEEDEEEDDADDGKAEKKVEVPHYISPGFMAFTEMLPKNKTLKYIDLGYCQLSADSLILLSKALQENTTVEYLNLEGNKVGEQPAPKVVQPPPEEPEAAERKSDDEEDEEEPGEEKVVEAPAVTPQKSESESDDEEAAKSTLLRLLESLCISGVKHLNFSSNDFSDVLEVAEAKALAVLCGKLFSLELNNVGLSKKHLEMWSDAFEEAGASTLVSLHLKRNYFSGAEDGSAVGKVVQKCPALREFAVDENSKLGSAGLMKIASQLPVTLRSLNVNRTGITTSTAADGTSVIPSALLKHLNHLSLGDMSCADMNQMHDWVSFVAEHGTSLRYLSMWSRSINMEVSLDPFYTLVQTLPELLYIDFGVLLRFDMDPPDVTDTLGLIEKVLTARRLERCFKDPPPEKLAATPAKLEAKAEEQPGGEPQPTAAGPAVEEEAVTAPLAAEAVLPEVLVTPSLAPEEEPQPTAAVEVEAVTAPLAAEAVLPEVLVTPSLAPEEEPQPTAAGPAAAAVEEEAVTAPLAAEAVLPEEEPEGLVAPAPESEEAPAPENVAEAAPEVEERVPYTGEVPGEERAPSERPLTEQNSSGDVNAIVLDSESSGHPTHAEADPLEEECW